MSKQTLSKEQISLSRKIILSMFFTTLSMVLVMNVFMVVAAFYIQILNYDKEVDYLQNHFSSIVKDQEAGGLDYVLIDVVETAQPSYVANFIFLPSRLETGISRSFQLDNAFTWSLFSRFNELTYRVIVFRENQYLAFSYPMAQDILRFWSIFRWILVIEGFFLVSHLLKFNANLSRHLSPTSQLTRSTKKMQREVSQLAVSANTKQIQSIATAIEKIDVHKLDNPLVVEASHKELQKLTTAINEMLERINQTVSSQTQFVSDASHELRTPIAIIQGNINLIDRWGKQDPVILQESIDAIKNETENMKMLVEHLLFLARGDSEAITLNVETFDVVTLIEETIADMKFIDPDRLFEFSHIQDTTIGMDKALLKQALRILLDNSMKYSAVDTPIKLSFSNQDNHHLITISDQGIGIQSSNIERMFDRFYRDDNARSNRIKGSGLGLAIVKWIVEKHKGYIELLSRENIGTKVSLYFPMASNSARDA